MTYQVSRFCPQTWFWQGFGDEVTCDRIEKIRLFTFSSHGVFSYPDVSRFPCLPYLLVLRLRRSLPRREHCACLYYPHSPSLTAHCVALLPPVFIVAISAGRPIFPVRANRCASYSQCGIFSAISPPVHEKSLPSGSLLLLIRSHG